MHTRHIQQRVTRKLLSPLAAFFLKGLCCIILLSEPLQAQVLCSAVDSIGSAYSTLRAAGLDFEDPDCEHTDFGPHVTQAYDRQLDKNVFVFHSHIVDDSDRCQVLDRVRMEIKGGPGTDLELQHLENDTSYYRWKFRIDDDFIGGSSFNHIFQNKAKGGNDDNFPVLTLTLRTDRIELRHDAGDTGASLGVLSQTSIDQFRGHWMEVYLMQIHSEQGSLDFAIRSMETGIIIMDHWQEDIDLWRIGAEYNRPKWGMYRLKNTALQDEEIRFSDFCVSEEDMSLCPSDAVIILDTIPPTPPLDLRRGLLQKSSVELLWEPSSDAFGVIQYEILQDGEIILETTDTALEVTGLQPETTYIFTVRATDEAGNVSEESNPVIIMTYAEDAFPSVPTAPQPTDLASDINPAVMLQWNKSDNTDHYLLYLGTDQDPPLISQPLEQNRFDTTLVDNTSYYWQVGSINQVGETRSPLWSFMTSTENIDAPWQVYRAIDRPHIETNFYELNESPAEPPLDELQADPNGSSNTYYAFRSDTNDKFRWRHNFSAADSVITIVVRLQAANDAVGGIAHFEIRANGYREKVRINADNVKLERSDLIEVEHGLDLINEMHLFRIVSDGKHTSVYIDESATPLITGSSNTEDSNTYFEWGKSGGADYGAIVDWLAIDKTGGYAPKEGSDLPDNLFLNSIATLSDLSIDGETVSGFSPNVIAYVVEVTDNDVPELSWSTTSQFVTVIATVPTTVPNTEAKIEVSADDGYTTKSYTINYLGSSSTHNSALQHIDIFPNPVYDVLHIIIADGSSVSAAIYSEIGTLVKNGILIEGQACIDLSSLSSGMYTLMLADDDKQYSPYRFNKQNR